MIVLVVCNARIGETMGRRKATMIHDPIVISSGVVASDTSRGIAIVVGLVSLSVGVYVPYGPWPESAR